MRPPAPRAFWKLLALGVSAPHLIEVHHVGASFLEYSRNGRLIQLEHTLGATRRGGTCVGACTSSGGAICSWGGGRTSAPQRPRPGASSPLATADAERPGFSGEESGGGGGGGGDMAYPARLCWDVGGGPGGAGGGALSGGMALAAVGLAGDAAELVRAAREQVRR